MESSVVFAPSLSRFRSLPTFTRTATTRGPQNRLNGATNRLSYTDPRHQMLRLPAKTHATYRQP